MLCGDTYCVELYRKKKVSYYFKYWAGWIGTEAAWRCDGSLDCKLCSSVHGCVPFDAVHVATVGFSLFSIYTYSGEFEKTAKCFHKRIGRCIRRFMGKGRNKKVWGKLQHVWVFDLFIRICCVFMCSGVDSSVCTNLYQRR